MIEVLGILTGALISDGHYFLAAVTAGLFILGLYKKYGDDE